MIEFVLLSVCLLVVCCYTGLHLFVKVVSDICRKHDIINADISATANYRSCASFQVCGIDIHSNILLIISHLCQKFVPLRLNRMVIRVVELNVSPFKIPCIALRHLDVEAEVLADEYFNAAIIEEWAKTEKSNIANYLTLVLETTSFDYKYGFIRWLCDMAMSIVSIECEDIRVRITAPYENAMFGITCALLAVNPKLAHRTQRGVPRQVSVEQFVFFVNHSTATELQPLLSFATAQVQVFLPYVFKELLAPKRQLSNDDEDIKQLKVSGESRDMMIYIHQEQLHSLLFQCLQPFQRYNTWKSQVQRRYEDSLVSPTEIDCASYRTFYRLLKHHMRYSKMRPIAKDIATKVAALERVMFLEDIMSLRREVHDWHYDVIDAEEHADSDDINPYITDRLLHYDPSETMNCAMASMLLRKRALYDDMTTPLRGIDCAPLIVRKLHVVIATRSTVVANFYAERGSARFALNVARPLAIDREAYQIDTCVNVVNYYMKYFSQSHAIVTLVESHKASVSENEEHLSLEFRRFFSQEMSVKLDAHDALLNLGLYREVLQALAVIASAVKNPDVEDLSAGTSPNHLFLKGKNIKITISVANVDIICLDDSCSLSAIQLVILNNTFDVNISSDADTEAFEVTMEEVGLFVGSCSYDPDESEIYSPTIEYHNNYSLIEGTLVEPLCSITDATVKYFADSKKESVFDRTMQEIDLMMCELWGHSMSRVHIVIDDIALCEFAFGEVVPMIQSPLVGIQSGDSIVAYIPSSNQNTRYVKIFSSLKLLVEQRFVPDMKLFLYDDVTSQRTVIGSCDISHFAEKGKGPIVSPRGVPIGEISFKRYITYPIVAIHVMSVRGIDPDAFKASSDLAQGAYLSVSAFHDAMGEDSMFSPRGNCKSIVRYTSSHCMHAEMYYNELLFYAISPNSNMVFKIDFIEEGVAADVTLGSASLVFDDKEFHGFVQLRDADRIVIGEVELEMCWLSQEIASVPDTSRYSRLSVDRRPSSRRLSRSISVESTSGGLKAEDAVFSNRFCDLLKGRDSIRTTIIRDVDIAVDGIRVSYNRSDIAHLLSIVNGMRQSKDDSSSPERHRQLSITSRNSDTLRYVHSGHLTQRCGDLNSFSIVSKILKRFLCPFDACLYNISCRHSSLAIMLAKTSPTSHLTRFWSLFRDMTELSDHPDLSFLSQHTKNTIRMIQQKLVLGFRNYSFALDAWCMVVCPAWLQIPRPGNIVNKGNSIYMAMSCPVGIGTRVYVDEKVYITAIDDRICLPLNGIRTIRRDHRYSSSKFLSFEVSHPCVIYLCWDMRITHIPSWIQKKEYTLTDYTVTTNVGVFSVYSKIVPEAAKVTIGGCKSKHANMRNYFILLGKMPDAHHEDGIKYDLFGWWLRKEVPIALDIAGVTQSSLDDASSIDLSIEDDLDSVAPLALEDRHTFYQYDIICSIAGIDLWCPENAKINYRPWLRLANVGGSFSCVQNHLDILRYSRMDTINACLSFTLSVETALAASYWKITPSSALEYYIEPVFVSMNVEKPEGQSIISADFNTDRHLVLNASPSMMVMLADIVDVSSRLHEIDEIDNTPRDNEHRHCPITQVVFHNNVGQHIKLKINNAAHEMDSSLGDEEEDSFICNIPYSDHMIFRLPNTFEESDPLASLRVSMHTAGWTVVDNITLCPGEERLYSIDQVRSLRSESSASEDSTDDNNDTWKTVTSRSAHEREFGTQTLRNHYHTYGLSPIPVSADHAVSTFTRLLDSTYDYEVSKDSPFAIVVKCQVTPLTQYREEYSALTDGGNMFSDSNSSSDGGTQDETLSFALVVNFCTNLTFHNQSTGPVNISYAEDDDHITALISHGASKSLPLSVFSKHGFDMRRMWGPDELIDECSRITVLKANLNTSVARRLRTSKEHIMESVRIDWTRHDVSSSSEGTTRSFSIGSSADASVLGNGDVKHLDSMAPVLWNLTLMPAITFTNALPCELEVQVSQCMSVHSAPQSKRKKSFDGAKDLFFLPEDFYIADGKDQDVVADDENWTPFNDEKPLVSQVLSGGRDLRLPNYFLDRNLYFRVRIADTNLWSKVYVLRASLHTHKLMFHKHKPEDLEWNYPRGYDFYSHTGPQLKYVRAWEASRDVIFFAENWIVNKSGIALCYDSEIAADEDTPPPKKSTVYQSLTNNGPCSTKDTTKLVDIEWSDTAQFKYMGNFEVPVLLSCNSGKLRVLPYAMAADVDKKQLFLSDIRCKSNRFYRAYRGLQAGMHVYADEASTFTGLPDTLIAKNSDSCIYVQTFNADRYSKPFDYDFISFIVSNDAFVTVAVDARCQKPPNWLMELGFVNTSERIHTDTSFTVYHAYRKYYRSHDRVVLGGNRAVASNDTIGRGTTVNMYLILVTDAPDGYVEPTISKVQVHRPKMFAKSPALCIKRKLSVGDSLYVDSTVIVERFPAILRNVTLLCLQTLQNDKSVSRNDFIEFVVQRPSRVILGFEVKTIGLHKPKWIGDTGFSSINVQLSAGNVVYDLYHKSYGEEVCILGGMEAKASPETYNYCILIADELELQRSINNLPYCSTLRSCSDSLRMEPSSPVTGICDCADFSVNSFWDSTHGDVTMQQPMFDTYGRSWSKYIDVAPGNAGELSTPTCTFSVVIKRLPGVFHRTKLIHILPRYVVLNQLHIPLVIWPERQVLSQNTSILSLFSESSHLSSHTVSRQETRHVVVQPGHTCAIYGFHDIGDANDDTSNEDTSKRWIRIQHHNELSKQQECTPSYATCPISISDVGDMYVWLHDEKSSERFGDSYNPNSIVVHASVMLQNSIVVATLSDSSQSPPYRLENRTSFSLQFRQATKSWETLLSRVWKSFLWEDPHGIRRLEVKMSLDTEGRSISYPIDEIGSVELYNWKLKRPSESSSGDDSAEDKQGTIGGHVYADGTTRVLVLYELSSAQNMTKQVSYPLWSSPMKSSANIPISLPVLHKQQRRLIHSVRCSLGIVGINFNVIIQTSKNTLEEMLCVTLEGIGVTYDAGAHVLELVAFHLQVDDMRPNCRFPIVYIPVDSGLNSHLRDDKQPTPAIRVLASWRNEVDTKVIHICTLEFALQEVQAKLDIDLVMELVGVVGNVVKQFSRHTTSHIHAAMHTAAIHAALAELQFTITQDVISASRQTSRPPVYIELFHHSSIIVGIEVLLGQKFLHLDPDLMDDSVAVGFAVLGGPILSFLSSVMGSIAHASPTFRFNELIISNYFGDIKKLMKIIVVAFKRQALVEVAKILGSIELLGDPFSLFDNLGTGVADFFRKTRSELIGDADTRGEGVRRLAQAVVGGTFGSASKMSGSLAEMVRNVTGLEELHRRKYDEHGVINTSMAVGIRHGSDMLVNSVTHGVTGLIDHPVEGFQRYGLTGALKGTLKGLVGLVASPVTGALGAVAVVAESVERNAKFRSGGPIGRRRKRRIILRDDDAGVSESSLTDGSPCHLDIITSDSWNPPLPKK